ncbi:transcriptional regulator PpsR [Sphingomonas spermidinifaciens]|uniref:Transcriptional regulator PpsR n=1 Tax=Sphingomonas spermidinifaciens TaxID=1141889 RepID=A0A2A4B9V8_9SPHN|nr:transcriptional regulator PpsR [Sphingomonas spermidinifaciens]
MAPARHSAFTRTDAVPAALDAGVAAGLLAAVGDVALILSGEGRILDVAVSNGELSHHGLDAWVGEAWAETVTPESRTKVAEMIADAAVPGSTARWRQVNHPAAGGDVPIRYLVMALGSDGRLVAIGRDMRGAAQMQQRLLQAQQSLERDYIRLRQAETRYRLLFETASEPVLIVDAGTRRIREANPAAHRLLGVAEGALVGEPIHILAAPVARDSLVAYLGAVEAADDVPALSLDLAGDRGNATVSARPFRQARAPLLLVRIADAAPADRHRHDGTLSDVVERMPDAFVLIDRNLEILTANAAFVDLAEAPSAERVVGARLGHWLGRPGIDLELMVAQLREHGQVRNVATILRGSAGGEEAIEVSAVLAPGPSGECFGFTLRSVGRRLRDAPAIPRDLPRSVEQLTGLVGRMSLKDIVRESTDLIERLCIEAALAYTADNRASAAEILGVSRQSLYSKLHRHGLGNLVSSDD